MFRIRTMAVAIATCFALAACSPADHSAAAANADGAGATAASGDQAQRTNPLLAGSDLPFHAPRFDQIQDSDFKPAIEQAMREHDAEIDKIINNPQPPTFDNTYKALQQSGQMLSRVMRVFGILTSTNTNPELQRIRAEMAPRLAAHRDAISLNETLFQRLDKVYEQRKTLDLDPESLRLVNVIHRRYVHSGAKLSAADQAKLKTLNQKSSKLHTQFSERLLAANRNAALVVDDVSALDGLSEGRIAAAAQAAKARGLDGKWVLSLRSTTQQPALSQLRDRATRKAFFQASWTRAEQGDDTDTRQIILERAKVRAQKAALFGDDNWAQWKLYDRMLKSPEKVQAFLHKLVPPALAQVQREAEAIQTRIEKDGHDFRVQPWDWSYYAEQVRKDKYDIDQERLRPYFELDNVLRNGVFYAAHELYGLSFKERTDIPVYHDDVRVFEITDADGSPLGLFYADYFRRDNKRGGAWMGYFSRQSKLLNAKPVIYNVANFAKPADGRPALLTWSNVITMFHEFGHALHGFLAEQEYRSLSGTHTARDFAEFPSQFNEYWATNPKVFAHYAKHYKTGEAMPAGLMKKVRKAATFNAGYDMTELLASALLDMHWHTLDAAHIPTNVDDFEAKVLARDGLWIDYAPPRYRTSYFKHIWASGSYSAGYYAYLWTKMLADNAHQWFLDHGGLTRENGERFRRMILSRGNTQDLETLYRNWLGHEPEIGPMLEYRGLQHP